MKKLKKDISFLKEMLDETRNCNCPSRDKIAVMIRDGIRELEGECSNEEKKCSGIDKKTGQKCEGLEQDCFTNHDGPL